MRKTPQHFFNMFAEEHPPTNTLPRSSPHPEPGAKRAAASNAAMRYISDHDDPSVPGGTAGVLVRLFLRFFQFVLGLTVCGLYGQDLSAARKQHKYADSHWVYAVFVGGLAAFVALLYLVPQVPWRKMMPVDVTMFILWVVVFGIFGRMYIREDPENVGAGSGPGIQRMKNAVWVDLTNALLWLITAAWGAFLWWAAPRKTLHTGRAYQ